MIKHKYVKIIFWALVSTVIITLYVIRIIKVNNEYPQTNETEVKYNDEFIDNNGISMTINNVEFLSGEEYIDKYGENIDVNSSTNTKVVIANMILINKNSKESTYDLTKMYIEKGGYCNGIPLDTFYLLNQNGNMIDKLQKGKRVEKRLVYVLSDYYYTNHQWNNIDLKSYDIVYGFYPDKIKFKLS